MPIAEINKMSRLFQPIASRIGHAKKTDVPSKCSENLVKFGIIKQVNSGMYAFLPLGLRVLNKLTRLVEDEMAKIDAQKVLLPALSAQHLWEKTNRYAENASELYKVKDRSHKNYILGPTHEETICTLLSTQGLLQKTVFPIKLYQISSKWRDEMKPKLGFLRSKEFIMKDLYTFDLNLSNAEETYASVCKAYDNIFKKIGIVYTKAIGNPGSTGGIMTHEYHYVSDIGEDIICTCSSCQYAINKTMCKESHCPECKSELHEKCSAEVGHTFLLDTKYTKPLDVTRRLDDKLVPLVMGCFGLGLSRIFTVMSELLSTTEELRWPKHFAPYSVCVIPPKVNSKAEVGVQYLDGIIDVLNQLNLDTILDDRTNLSIGYRFIHARMTGFPYVIVIGRSITQSPPMIEVHDINNATNTEIPVNDLFSYFNNENTKENIKVQIQY